MTIMYYSLAQHQWDAVDDPGGGPIFDVKYGTWREFIQLL